MSTQIENLKQELREFIELSKTYMNVSAATVECLLVAVEGLETISLSEVSADPYEACNCPSDAQEKLEKILTIWEASK